MARKKIGVGLLTIAMTFGIAAMSHGMEDPFLNGTWRRGSDFVHLDNGHWGPSPGVAAGTLARGTYTANDGRGTFVVTHIHSNMMRNLFRVNIPAGWYSRSELIAAVSTLPPGVAREMMPRIDDLFEPASVMYSVSGNTLTLTLSGALAGFFAGEWIRSR